MADSSSSYIHMVQYMIEKCLINRMTKEECMESLRNHAEINPVITSTIWNELEKENKGFFEAYAELLGNKSDKTSVEELTQVEPKLASEPSKSHSDESSKGDGSS